VVQKSSWHIVPSNLSHLDHIDSKYYNIDIIIESEMIRIRTKKGANDIEILMKLGLSIRFYPVDLN
jgi:hypothetical protein